MLLEKTMNRFKANIIVRSSLALLFFLAVGEVMAQSEMKQILQRRTASNEAIRNFDNELSYTYLTEDVLITTGSGVLLSGKEELRQYVEKNKGSKMYWVRSAVEVDVNSKLGLAWEKGTWQGFDPAKGKKAVVQGKYSAMWSKSTGTWLIKSQLFVTLK